MLGHWASTCWSPLSADGRCGAAGKASEGGHRQWLGLPPFTVSFWAVLGKVLFAAASVAAHGIAMSVFGVLLASMAFATRVGPMSLALALQVGLGVILGPEEPFAFSFSVSSVVFEVSSEFSDWFASVPSPHSPGFSVGHVDVLGRLCFTHVLDSRVRKFLGPVIRGSVGVGSIVPLVRHGGKG